MARINSPIVSGIFAAGLGVDTCITTCIANMMAHQSAPIGASILGAGAFVGALMTVFVGRDMIQALKESRRI